MDKGGLCDNKNWGNEGTKILILGLNIMLIVNLARMFGNSGNVCRIALPFSHNVYCYDWAFNY